VGSLLPILTVPVQMAQDFTDLLPTGSVPAQISQNFTNVLATGLDTSLVANAGSSSGSFHPRSVLRPRSSPGCR